MKIIKYLAAIFFSLFALYQLFSVFTVLGLLLQGQGDNEATFLTGKLFGHLFIIVLTTVIAYKLYSSAKE